MNTTISCKELFARLSGGNPPLVVDVLPPEIYAVRHLPGACNACVYEMVFRQGIAELAPDLSRTLVVYDETGTTAAAATAREKLLAAGYGDVLVLSGGLAGWAAAGYPVEQLGSNTEAAVIRDGRYRLDPAASVLEWTGRNINNRHYGRIPFSRGELVINRGELRQGEIVLDMTGITNLDLQDDTYRQMLVSHLKSDDFFDVQRYPAAAITISGWQAINGAAPGTPDHVITAALTIKGVTRELSFPAMVMPQEDGSLKAQATFDLDRTAWGINYGSGRLFEKLGMHLVNDRIDIELFIVVR
jgi:polyisoprenoid-binding protein YceI